MDAVSFAYWLQGYFELSEDEELSKEQVHVIKDHLCLVFDKQTPDRKTKIPDVRRPLASRGGKIC